MSASGPDELLLVRHGESEMNVAQRLTGWSDSPLTARGRLQAASLRELLHPFGPLPIHSSDLRRAVDTATLALGEPTRSSGWRELDFGKLEGVPWPSLNPGLRAAMKAFDDFEAPGGESVRTFRLRVLNTVSRLGEGRHVIFTHGGVIRLLLRELDEQAFVPNATVVHLDWRARTLLGVTPCPHESVEG
ncbi:MAG: histidine phosphatase family protein [Deltaproteobacteria bacterium]|nr:MAG: histidine phosphatase family protein [Deltaproteobacteria bacterium]